MNGITEPPGFAHQVSKRRNRARELVEEVMFDCKNVRQGIKKAQSVNLMCSVGPQQFDVYRLGVFGDDLISVLGKTNNGTEMKTFAPVEKVSFTVVLTQNASETPPREIGFDAIRREREKCEAGAS